jgi:energy-converting hydrogenase Eha subunit A
MIGSGNDIWVIIVLVLAVLSLVVEIILGYTILSIIGIEKGGSFPLSWSSYVIFPVGVIVFASLALNAPTFKWGFLWMALVAFGAVAMLALDVKNVRNFIRVDRDRSKEWTAYLKQMTTTSKTTKLEKK